MKARAAAFQQRIQEEEAKRCGHGEIPEGRKLKICCRHDSKLAALCAKQQMRLISATLFKPQAPSQAKHHVLFSTSLC